MCQVASVMSDSSRPNGLQTTRLLCPWDFLGKKTGEGCHALLQGIFLIQGSNLRLLHLMHWQVGSLPLGPPGKPRNLLITRTGMVGPLTRQGPDIPEVPVDFMRRSHVWYHVGWASLQGVTCHLYQQPAAKSCAPSVNKGPLDSQEEFPFLVSQKHGAQSNMGQVMKVIRKLGVLSRADQLWEKAPNLCLYIGQKLKP